MGSAQHSSSFAMDNVGFASDGENAIHTFVHTNRFQISLPPGNTVTAWVKTDSDTAACNLPSGHGQTNGKFDVFWTLAGVNYCRYGVDGTITTNALALDGGAGDAFPASATTGVVCTKQVSTVAFIDGDNIDIIGIFLSCPADTDARAHLDLQDSGAASIEALNVYAGGVNKMNHVYPVAQTVAAGGSNVFTGNVVNSAKASNSSTTATGTLYILSGEN